MIDKTLKELGSLLRSSPVLAIIGITIISLISIDVFFELQKAERLAQLINAESKRSHELLKECIGRHSRLP